MSAQPKPFKVEFKAKDIEHLRSRLKSARWPDELTGSGWQYGVPKQYLQELAQYWADGFDFQKTVAYLNTFPQYTLADVNGIDVHFIHQPSKHPGAIPLVISHGWPGSFFEFHNMVNQLADPAPVDGKRPQAFHVVAPSLPGFGFSSAPTKPGFSITQMAKTFDELMTRLGYSTYVAQGGDWGSAITSVLGRLYPQRCRAIHVNLLMIGPSPYNPLHWAQLANLTLPFLKGLPLLVTNGDVKGYQGFQEFTEEESGYFKEQSTKPQTLGYALTDSPLGLLAWITEKFHRWVDRKGSDTPELAITRDELLTNISIYWFSGNITSAGRIYKEHLQEQKRGQFPNNYCKVPTGVAVFPYELGRCPKGWAQASYNLQRWTEFPSGGHFAALEEPDLLTGDLRTFFAEHYSAK